MHHFDVTVTDGDGRQAMASYNILVLDENDNTPTFLSETYVEVLLPEDAPVSGGCGMRTRWGSWCVGCLCGQGHGSVELVNEAWLLLTAGHTERERGGRERGGEGERERGVRSAVLLGWSIAVLGTDCACGLN